MEMLINQLTAINFNPTSEADRIAQNVANILTTVKGTSPLNRGLGIDGGLIHSPTPAAIQMLKSSVIEAISRDEPRVEVLSVQVSQSNTLTGTLNPTVRIKIK